MSDENEIDQETDNRFATANVERIGWGLFIIFMGVSFYAEDLHRIRDSWDQISLYGGGFLLAFWFCARLINRSLSYGMLVVGSILVTTWAFEKYHLHYGKTACYLLGRLTEVRDMIRKVAALAGFVAGCYFGNKFTVEMLTGNAADFEGYWGQTGLEFIRVLLPLGAGVVAGVAAYFLTNLFARAD